MCIAIYVPNGVKSPSKAILKRCFKTNSDGAGFGWFNRKEKTWIVSKGHMSFKKFWKAYTTKKFTDNTEVVMHFRIGTSGKKAHPDCTHPFPVVGSFKEMILPEFKTDNIIVHNGIIGRGLGDASDTMVAVRDYIDPLLPHINDKKISVLLGELLEKGTSRWLLAKKDEVLLLGTWVEEDGVSYSNRGYKPIIATENIYPRPWRGGGWDIHNRDNTAYDWLPKSLSVVYSIYSFKDYTTKCPTSGIEIWNWEKFNKYLSDRDKQIELANTYQKNTPHSDDDAPYPSVDSKGDLVDDVYEIFNEDSRVIGVVDSSGDIIWEDPDSSTYDVKPCPYCPEKKNIVESPFSIGDSMCCRCGAVFVHGLQGTEAIMMWDQDINEQYRRMLRIMAGEND